MTFIYKDLDLSFEKGFTNDIGVLTDIQSIKNTFYNNLLILSDEIPFYNTPKQDINDAVEEMDDFLTRKYIDDVVIETANKDPRIDKVSNVNITTSEEYKYKIEISFVLRDNTKITEPADITLLVGKL